MIVHHNRYRFRYLYFFLFLLIPLSCGDAEQQTTQPASLTHRIKMVSDAEHFRRIIGTEKDRLLVFDFSAEWCQPCKILAPILLSLSEKFGDRASFYEIDIDRNRELAAAAGARGVPYVLFIKNGRAVHALTGLHPKDTYRRAVERFSDAGAARSDSDTADGEIIEGTRVIRRSTASPLDTLYVYRGETVKLIIEEIRFPYAIHIPEYGISKTAEDGQDLEVRFKAKKVGVYPIFCNGNCPTGDGNQSGRIVVMQYASSGDTRYQELSASQAKALMERTDLLVLDVRTPGEYYSGRLKNAQLIPVQQLEARLSEIQSHKEKDILLYCRSGNRSTVAAEILTRGGFKSLYNLRHGIVEWKQKGYEIVQ